MDTILNDKELFNVNGGMTDGTDPNIKRAKTSILAAFRVAQGLNGRIVMLEDLLRDAYLKLYGTGMDLPRARNSLKLAKVWSAQIRKEFAKRIEINSYIDLALDDLSKVK